MITEIYNDMQRIHIHLRQEVLEFAEAMEFKLKKNDHKTGWQQQPIEAHIKLLRIEMMEFDVALEFLGDEEAAKECVDIANYALIIRDKLRARIAKRSCSCPLCDVATKPPVCEVKGCPNTSMQAPRDLFEEQRYENSKDWTR